MVTEPDRQIARLKEEIRKVGLDFFEQGKPRHIFPELQKLDEQLANCEQVSFHQMNSAQQAQYMHATKPIYEQMRALHLAEVRGYGNDRIDIYNATRHASLRVSFYVNSDPERALAALSLQRALAEQLGRRGELLAHKFYREAYEECIEAWIDQPDLLQQVRELERPYVDPMDVVRIEVEEFAFLFKDPLGMRLSPGDLWDALKWHYIGKQQQLEYFSQVLTMLREAQSRSVVDLAKSASKSKLALQRTADEPWHIFDSIPMNLDQIASVQVSRQQCEAFIEMQHTDPKATVLPKREPFIDPFSGEPFLLHLDGDQLWIMSVGPNGRPDMGKEDDIVAKFKLRP